MDKSRRWLLCGSFVVFLGLGIDPAKASGFLDFNVVTGRPCQDDSDINCYDLLSSSTVEIHGIQIADLGTEFAISSDISYSGTFNYAYAPEYVDYQRAYYKIGNNAPVYLDSTGGATSATTYSYSLAAGEELVFGVENKTLQGDSGAAASSTLAIQNFNSTENVPAPLPLLGAAAAFGAIRRRRAALRIAAAAQSAMSSK